MDARRYLLYLLSKSEFVHRADLGKVAPISHEMVTNMVAEIACFVHGKGWRLKVSPDRSFLSKFPQVQQQQTDNVVREGLAAKDRLSAKPKSTATTSSKAKKDSNINTAATTSGGEVVEEFPIKGETEDEQLVSLVRSVLLHHGLASMNYIERSVKKRMGDKGKRPIWRRGDG